MARKILILTEGLSSPHSAKTACGVIRFRRDEVVGVLDTTVPPQPAQRASSGIANSFSFADVCIGVYPRNIGSGQ